jgi:predicted nucleotidyltransferase component of viral defense system
MSDYLHFEVLPENQLQLFERLSAQSFFHDFYLAGGTCLALLIGHRRSIDFDFFIPADFDTSAVVNKLTYLGSYKRDNEEKNTINGSLDGVRISFFGYRYNIIDDFRNHNNIRLAGLKDIAAMKIEAIAGRGSKKDFIDIYFLLQRYTLNEIFEFHTLKYGTGLSNRYHHLKSLVYFTDADTEAMPLMIKPLNWDDVKNQISSCVRQHRIG